MSQEGCWVPRTVAVERGLSDVCEQLRAAGYQVVDLDERGVAAADAIVVSGMNVNLMQAETTLTPAPVIVAKGRNAEEVVREVQRRAVEQG